MELLFQYFSKKQICSTPEEAVEFIESLHQRNRVVNEKLIVNDYCRNQINELFSGEKPRYTELRTTNCSNTYIVVMQPLAQTVEEHDAALAQIAHEREQKYLAEIHEVKKGWYAVDVDVNIADLSGRRQRVDKCLHVEVVAQSKAHAYMNVCQHYKSGADPEIVDPIFSEDFVATYLGERTDTGYSEMDKLLSTKI